MFNSNATSSSNVKVDSNEVKCRGCKTRMVAFTGGYSPTFACPKCGMTLHFVLSEDTDWDEDEGIGKSRDVVKEVVWSRVKVRTK